RPTCTRSGSSRASALAISGLAVSETACACAKVRPRQRVIQRPAGSQRTAGLFVLRCRTELVLFVSSWLRGCILRDGERKREAMARIEVGILGATGMVGQQFIALLAKHPWFTVTWLGASERSAGKAYREAAAWRLSAPLADETARMQVNAAAPGAAPRLVFSGLDSSVAGEIEAAFAQAGHVVVSNARNYRMESTVPLLIPEVNGDHLALLDAQRAAKGWSGGIVTNPNCAVVVLAMALAPLRQFGLSK